MSPCHQPQHWHHSCRYVNAQVVCSMQGRITPAEAAQIHRMQAKQQEKAGLEAILEQVQPSVGNTGTSADASTSA